MGGLILRAALPYLSNYQNCFDTLITLATPHLGYININNNILTTGMMVASAFSSNNLISEMRLKDTRNINK